MQFRSALVLALVATAMPSCEAFAPKSVSSSVTTTALHMSNPTQSFFLTPETAKAAVEVAGGTPLYAYSLEKLEKAADDCLAFPNAYGLTVRYAMKACPNQAILNFFNSKGIHIDASSGFECRRAMAAGIPAENISLSTQELPADFAELCELGVKLNACSISQLERFAAHFKDNSNVKVGIRINPGVGSGGFSKSTTGFSKTNVGGPSSSFGIWHEFVEGPVKKIVEENGLTVERIHTHIGSGSDPAVWQQVALKSLSFCKIFPTVETLNLGGGYKVGRNPGEPSTNLQEIGGPVAEEFRKFAADQGRELRLEIEPGTYLLAMSGALVSTVQDKVSTLGEGGHVFLKLDAGMTDVLRPSLYGAVHPTTILPGSGKTEDVGSETEQVVVVGHCCESGDLMTPLPGEPESLAEITLRKASIGDILVMDGSGAYCSGMSTKNYNSFPEAPEVLVDKSGKAHLIRKRQEVTDMWKNEMPLPTELLGPKAAAEATMEYNP